MILFSIPYFLFGSVAHNIDETQQKSIILLFQRRRVQEAELIHPQEDCSNRYKKTVL